PLRRIHLLNARPRLNRGGADEAIDTAEAALDLAQGSKRFSAISDVEAPRRNPRNIGERGHRRAVHVADDDARSGLRGGARQGAADAVGSAGHHDHVSRGLEARSHGHGPRAASSLDSKLPSPTRVAVSIRLFTVAAS